LEQGFLVRLNRILHRYLKHKLTTGLSGGCDGGVIEFVPYYEGFTGCVSKIDDKKFLIKGKYTINTEEKITITELPIGTWTMPYITYLDELVDGHLDKTTGKKLPPKIKDYVNLSTEKIIHIEIVFHRGAMCSEMEKKVDGNGVNEIEKLMKLTTTVSTSNMHLFNHELKLRKYETVEEIIDEYYEIRYNTYVKRKEYLVAELEKKVSTLTNKARYILAILDGSIDLRRKSNDEITEILKRNALQEEIGGGGGYKYLVKMTMDSVSTENVEKILKEKNDMEENLAILKSKTVNMIWLEELDNLEKEYIEFKKMRNEIQNPVSTSLKNGGVVLKKITKSKKIVEKK
jgi:DNA topoisomerase-2